MVNPAKTINASADVRIPGLPLLPIGTDRSLLLLPVYDPATDDTYQTELLPSDGAVTSNDVVGGPKLVQYLDSRLTGVPSDALTLDRLNPMTIVPGTVATVDNPASSPLATTLPAAQYVATRTSATAAGAVLVPAYIGAAAGDTVAIVWAQVASSSYLYTDVDARAAQLSRVAPAGTTTITLTGESPEDYGTAATGTFTVDPTGCQVGKTARFGVAAGAAKPVFNPAPAGQPYAYYPADIFTLGQAFRYSLCVCSDEIQVVISPK